MKGLIALVFTVSAALAAPAFAGPSDRHEGVYRFVPAPERHCLEQVRRNEAAPARPQRLTEMPAAYAIRLKNDAETKPAGCFRIQRER